MNANESEFQKLKRYDTPKEVRVGWLVFAKSNKNDILKTLFQK